MIAPNTTDTAQDGRADFDFLLGRWKIHNRRLRERLKESTSWEEFEATSVIRPVLGGLGNVDEVTLERASGRVEALTLRLYDPQAQEWSIYWVSGTDGLLQTPMIGGFTNGRGLFFSQEPFEGRHIFSRFIWTVPSPTTCRWEQAFSPDGGATWETNWTMDFSRIPPEQA